MAVYRRSRRHRFFLLLLTLTSVTVITLDYRGAGSGTIESVKRTARDALAPVQSAAANVLDPVGNFFSGLTHFNSLERENQRLQAELDQARANQLATEGAEREREALLDLLRLDFASTIPAVPARVIASAPSNFQNTVIIDRGSNQGVAVGQPVVAGAGLVGRVLEVSNTRATIQLLSDRSSNLGVRLTGSGEIGIATGGGSKEPLRVGFVPSTAKVEAGEAVVTSGLEGSAYPPEIPVGRVKSTDTSPGAIEQHVIVEPSVDFARLEFVRVLLWSGQR
ncbi:MAG: rod shape-determining protein MreC [Acidimicrobiales bacterium]